MGRRISRRIWIGDRYEGHIFYVQKDDIKWRIGKKLSERSYFIPKYSDQGKTTAWTEAQAVFPCEQVYGPSVGAQAILKVRMQIPPEEYPSLDPAVRARHATTDYSPRAQGEVNSLAYFKNNGCSVTPRLLSTAVESQPINDPSMPVPGGYIFSILMERVPGVPLGDFWTYDPEKREKIRNSFRKGMIEILNLHGYPMDGRLDNLVYDEKSDKCYFVDLESLDICRDEPCRKFSDFWYFEFELAIDEYEGDTLNITW